MADDVGRMEEALRRCTRFLNGHGRRTAADMLAGIPPDTEMDRYGAGGVVARLERRMAVLLGKEAALFFPSGTMAQQIVLRVHAERRGRRTIVYHPYCHLDWYEGRGYARLHGLVGVPAGPLRQPLTLDTLAAVPEPPAALLLELPQRDLGGWLPAWEDLQAQVAWARSRGAAVHMDGARLWEATPYYAKAPADIAALFDTVYVSFYKGLGGLAGCVLAGPADIVAEAAEWRVRHGGRLVALWPYAAAAETALEQRLPLMPRYFAHARAIAAALGGVPGVTVLPHPPHAPMMHLSLDVTRDELLTRCLTIAERDGVWTFPRPFASDEPRRQRLEFTVGDATLGFPPAEVRRLVAELAGAG